MASKQQGQNSTRGLFDPRVCALSLWSWSRFLRGFRFLWRPLILGVTDGLLEVCESLDFVYSILCVAFFLKGVSDPKKVLP